MIAGAGCRDRDYPAPHSPQEAMSRNEPIAPVLGPAHPGDPGVVSGRLTLVETFAPAAPVEYQTVALFHDGKEVSRATTDAHGAFLFVRVKGGQEYELRVVSDRLTGNRSFRVRESATVDLVVQPVVASKP